MAEGSRQRRTGNGSRMGQAQSDRVYTIDLEELFYQLLSKWKLVVCLAVGLAVLFGAYAQFFVTPMYKATAVIYVLNREDSAVSISDLNLGTALAADYLKVFTLWEVHEEVITNLDLPYTYKEMEEMLTVNNDSQTRMLDISIESENPTVAAKIANEYATVVSKYIESTMSIKRPALMSVARVPANPVRPDKVSYILIGFLLGLVLAVGSITIQVVKDDMYKTAEDIRRYTGLNTLAVVPEEDFDITQGKGAKRL